jgi:hypothetical protein
LSLVNTAAIGMAVVVVVAGVMTLLVEQRKPERKLSQRRRVLEIGVGVLLIAATFAVPVVSRLIPSTPVAPGAGMVSSAALPDRELINTGGAIGGGAEPEGEDALAPTRTPMLPFRT